MASTMKLQALRCGCDEYLFLTAALLMMALSSRAVGSAPQITVAAYYYPCEHPDPRWDKAKYPGFTEWDLSRKAKPRLSARLACHPLTDFLSPLVAFRVLMG